MPAGKARREARKRKFGHVEANDELTTAVSVDTERVADSPTTQVEEPTPAGKQLPEKKSKFILFVGSLCYIILTVEQSVISLQATYHIPRRMSQSHSTSPTSNHARSATVLTKPVLDPKVSLF